MATLLPLKKSDVDLLKDKASELGVIPGYLEKDYYAVQLIKCLSDICFENGHLIFAGGTALAKAYQLIHRFSEDCDFLFVIENSTPSVRKNFKEKIKQHLIDYGFNTNEDNSSNKRYNIEFKIQYHCQTKELGALRPELKLEFIIRDNILFPTQIKSVISFLNEIKAKKSEVNQIECLSPEEIATGKISSLIWRFLDETKETDPTRIRHLHDLAAMKNKLEKSTLFKRESINVTEKDLKDRLNSTMNFQEATILLIKKFKQEEKYKIMYETYVQNFIYQSEDYEFLTFEKALNSFEDLINSIN